MNTQAIRAGRCNVVLIVMMREVDVVHYIFPLAVSRHARRLDGFHSERVCAWVELRAKIPGLPLLPAPVYGYDLQAHRRPSCCGSRLPTGKGKTQDLLCARRLVDV